METPKESTKEESKDELLDRAPDSPDVHAPRPGSSDVGLVFTDGVDGPPIAVNVKAPEPPKPGLKPPAPTKTRKQRPSWRWLVGKREEPTTPCASCKKPIASDLASCPHCATPVARAATPSLDVTSPGSALANAAEPERVTGELHVPEKLAPELAAHAAALEAERARLEEFRRWKRKQFLGWAPLGLVVPWVFVWSFVLGVSWVVIVSLANTAIAWGIVRIALKRGGGWLTMVGLTAPFALANLIAVFLNRAVWGDPFGAGVLFAFASGAMILSTVAGAFLGMGMELEADELGRG
jgi:hypothetical protein